MKPKAPKKKDAKPSAKSGEVRENGCFIVPLVNYINDNGEWILEFKKQDIERIKKKWTK